MAASIREQILQAIKTTLDATSGVNGRVYRSRVEPIARQESPAIVVEPAQDVPAQNTALPTLDWSLLVRVGVITRGLAPDMLADPIVVSMHSLLMADLTLGGLAIDIQPGAVSFQMIEADQPAGVVVCDYLVRYRTTVENLSQ